MIGGLGKLLVPILRLPTTPPQLPAGAHEIVAVERAAPGYLRYRRAAWLLRVVAVVTAMFSLFAIAQVMDDWGVVALEGFVLFVTAASVVLKFFVIRLDYELRWYLVTDRSLLIREGIWSVREISLTFANVQNVSVTQGPLQRMFGISDVVVTTAGGASPGPEKGQTASLGHAGHLRGVAEPQRVRDLILDLMRRHKGAGLGDPDDPEPTAHTHVGTAPALSPRATSALSEAAGEARRIRSLLGS